MLKFGIFAAALAAAAFAGGNAFAAPISATAINADCADDVAVGGTLSGINGAVTCRNPTLATADGRDDNRDDVSAIEFNTPAVGNFYSLGLNGSVVFEITPAFTGAGMIAEVTNPSSHYEAVDIFGSIDGAGWTLIDTLKNNTGSPSVTAASFFVSAVYSYIGFVDATGREFSSTASNDGYDIASFSLTAVPLPATLPLMMTAFGGLALVRRIRRRA